MERLLGWWLVYWHGEGEPHQYQFYRCHGCRNIVTHRLIVTGGCPCEESSKISPAKLRLGEKARLLLMPWTVTPWARRQDSARRLQALAVRKMLDELEASK